MSLRLRHLQFMITILFPYLYACSPDSNTGVESSSALSQSKGSSQYVLLSGCLENPKIDGDKYANSHKIVYQRIIPSGGSKPILEATWGYKDSRDSDTSKFEIESMELNSDGKTSMIAMRKLGKDRTLHTLQWKPSTHFNGSLWAVNASVTRQSDEASEPVGQCRLQNAAHLCSELERAGKDCIRTCPTPHGTVYKQGEKWRGRVCRADGLWGK